MDNANVARNFKDRLFVRVFGDKGQKENLLSLYNALNGTSYSNADALEITTIEDVVYMGMKNDVSFLIDNTMALYEHQSTYNPNMPLRGLLYASKLYESFVSGHSTGMFGHSRVDLPMPQFYVFYNGTECMKDTDRMELRLSDSFPKRPIDHQYEWTAIMLNINHGRNRELMEKCRKLEEYAACIAVIRECIGQADDWKQGIRTGVDRCIASGILADILSKNKSEVVDMLLTEYDEQKVMEQLRKEYLQEGRDLGRQEGHKSGVSDGIRMFRYVQKTLAETGRSEAYDLDEMDGEQISKLAYELGYED